MIANSAASAQAFAKLTSFDSARIDVVFNGIAADPFDALRTVPQAVLREHLNLPRDAFLVGSLSESSRRIDHLNGTRVIDRIRNMQTRFQKARYRYLFEVLQYLKWRVDSRVHPLCGYF
ncbi:poly(A) polymerase Pap1 [Paraburkholderia sp. Clong3]